MASFGELFRRNFVVKFWSNSIYLPEVEKIESIMEKIDEVSLYKPILRFWADFKSKISPFWGIFLQKTMNLVQTVQQTVRS